MHSEPLTYGPFLKTIFFICVCYITTEKNSTSKPTLRDHVQMQKNGELLELVAAKKNGLRPPRGTVSRFLSFNSTFFFTRQSNQMPSQMIIIVNFTQKWRNTVCKFKKKKMLYARRLK